MCRCIYVCVSVCLYACRWVKESIVIRNLHMYVCVHACMCACMLCHVCICICMHWQNVMIWTTCSLSSNSEIIGRVRILVSGSSDERTRQNGRTLRTLAPQVDHGPIKKIFKKKRQSERTTAIDWSIDRCIHWHGSGKASEKKEKTKGRRRVGNRSMISSTTHAKVGTSKSQLQVSWTLFFFFFFFFDL
jgi:hypothetical protein